MKASLACGVALSMAACALPAMGATVVLTQDPNVVAPASVVVTKGSDLTIRYYAALENPDAPGGIFSYFVALNVLNKNSPSDAPTITVKTTNRPGVFDGTAGVVLKDGSGVSGISGYFDPGAGPKNSTPFEFLDVTIHAQDVGLDTVGLLPDTAGSAGQPVFTAYDAQENSVNLPDPAFPAAIQIEVVDGGASVPEPATAGLVGLAAGAMGLVRARRRG